MALVQTALANQYRIEREIGHGGMAVVFRAHNLNLDRPVAIKVMRPEKGYEDGVVSRFLTEAVAVAKLRHPNIIGVHNRGELGEILWFEMDLVEGGSVSDLIEKGPLPPERAARFLAEAADALAYAHASGLIHRDIKPSNLLVDAQTDHLFVTDFGIAKLLGSSTLTEVGKTIGTVAYMSPEQLGVGHELTAATDQYSLGVVAYEMLTGTRPFSAETPVQFAVIQSTRVLPPLRSRAPQCPRDLATLVERMLDKDPARRWPDLSTVKRAAEEVAVTGSSRIVRVHPRPVRRLWSPPVIAAAALLLIGAGGWYLWPKGSSAANRPTNPPAPNPTAPVGSSLPPPPAVIPAPPGTNKAAPPDLGRGSKATPDGAGRGSVDGRGPRKELATAPDTVHQTPPPPPAAAPAPAPTTTLAMTTRTPGTFVYLNGDSLPISLHEGKLETRTLPIGPVRITIRSYQAGCHDRTLVDTLKANQPKRKQLDPDCPN